MSIIHKERLSDSPFVETVWHTQVNSDGSDVVSADVSWDMIISRRVGKTTLVVWGPMTKAVPVPHAEGEEHLGIRFKLGTLLTYLPVQQMLNSGLTLPDATSKTFWLGGSAWQFPDFENADIFIDRLVKNHLLVRDPVVDAALRGHMKDVSPRTVQRHFLRATGLTHSYIYQIERARRAVTLLQQGLPIINTAFAAGYTDQSHMTRSLKHLVGQTPAQIVRSKP
jgi:AraC-like DNA-binding protein